jgi:hypothetical protein
MTHPGWGVALGWADPGAVKFSESVSPNSNSVKSLLSRTSKSHDFTEFKFQEFKKQ